MTAYTTHLICAKCGTDTPVTAWFGMTEAEQESSPINLGLSGLLLFACPACGAVYPLPVAPLPVDRHSEGEKP